MTLYHLCICVIKDVLIQLIKVDKLPLNPIAIAQLTQPPLISLTS